MDLSADLPLLVDGVIVFSILEGTVLLVHHGLTGGGVRPRDFVLNLVSGVCLMLALRCSVREVGAPWTALCLMAAGLAHGIDLRLRWRRRTMRRA